MVVSLITPLDLANFHYLKKLTALEFVQAQLPSKESLLDAKIGALATRAKEKNLLADERISTLLRLVNSSPSRDEIVALLISNTFDALPAALANADKGSDRGEPREGQPFERDGRDGERRSRYDRSRRGGRRDEFDGAPPSDSSFESAPAEGSEEFAPRGRRGDRRNDAHAEPFVPPVRDMRLYVGHGSADGISQESLLTLAREKTELTPEQVKRVVVRKLYSFVDVSEDVADAAIAKLSEVEMSGGKKMLVKKAVSITAPRENKQGGEEDSAHQDHESDSIESAPASEAV